MITVNVELGERAYPIHIGSDLIGRTELFAPHIRGASVTIVTNTTVDPLYRECADFVIETGRPSVNGLVNMVLMQLEMAGVAKPAAS